MGEDDILAPYILLIANLGPINVNLGPVNSNLGAMKKQKIAVIIGKLLFFALFFAVFSSSIKCLLCFVYCTVLCSLYFKFTVLFPLSKSTVQWSRSGCHSVKNVHTSPARLGVRAIQSFHGGVIFHESLG